MPIVSSSGGGGAAAPANWCLVEIDGGPGVGADPALSVANPSYSYPQAALTILSQSGSDFSVGSFGGHGAILSAAGGFMQAGILVPPQFVVASIDAGSADERWIQLGMNIGDNPPAINALGYDCSFKVGAQGQQTFAGLPGTVQPGQPAVRQIRFLFENPFGTDSVTCDFWDAEALIIWTLGTL